MKTGQKLKQLQKRYNLNKHFYPWFAWYPVLEGQHYSIEDTGKFLWLTWVWRRDYYFVKGDQIIRRIAKFG